MCGVGLGGVLPSSNVPNVLTSFKECAKREGHLRNHKCTL